MALDIYLISISVVLLMLLGVMIVFFSLVLRSLSDFKQLFLALHQDLHPMLRDLRVLTVNAAAVSEEFREGMQRVGRMTQVVDNFSEDLDAGRRNLKSGLRMLGDLISPWLAKLKG